MRGPAQRRIEAGDLVVVDFGGVLDGYCTDLTRTVIVAGSGRRASRRLIEQVVEAQRRRLRPCGRAWRPKPWMRRRATTLARHGLAEAFTHGTGHGLGLEIHEAPARDAGRAGSRRAATGAGW